MNMNLSKLQEIVEDRQPGLLQSTGLQRAEHHLVAEQQEQQHGVQHYLYKGKIFQVL